MSTRNAGVDPAKGQSGRISTVHQYNLPLPREKVWTLISDVSLYRSWWPWLRAFHAAALAEGEEWRCEAQPPVPFPVRFRVGIEYVEAPLLVRAAVSGDVVGTATLSLHEAGVGCLATLESSLGPGNAALRMASRFVGPIARFGHDWVLDTGAHQFIARAGEPLASD